MRQSNSARAHSTDQERRTDVDGGDGTEQWGGSGIAERGHRGKDSGGVGSDGSPARLPESQGWLKLSEQPSARHPSGDVDGWVGFADVGSRSTGSARTVTDRVGWP